MGTSREYLNVGGYYMLLRNCRNHVKCENGIVFT